MNKKESSHRFKKADTIMQLLISFPQSVRKLAGIHIYSIQMRSPIKKALTLLIIFMFIQNNFAEVKNNNGIDSLYNSILKEYVKDGLVNYKELKEDKRLNEYINLLVNTDPSKIKDRNDQLAFWINAYNAYTLKIICDNYPVKSITDLNSGGEVISYILKTTVWDKDLVVINHKKMSLNDIEHGIIREKYNDPRIHFALVCAAISCPPLRSEAYIGSRLNEQLNDQGRGFFADTTKNRFNLKTHTVYLSKILDWYGSDFGNNDAEILLRITKYLPANIAKGIDESPGKWNVEFNDYNWSLNEIK